MSDDSYSVVRLDSVSPAEALGITERVRDLLLSRGVIARNDRFDPVMRPSAWKPGASVGPVLLEPVDWFDSFLTGANNGVDIRGDRDMYLPVEAEESPCCTRCEAPAPSSYSDSMETWLTEWSAGQEPTFTCDECGWSGPVGDWTGEFSVLVGAPAVVFNNWPALSPSFVEELRACLGGRTGVVYSHW